MKHFTKKILSSVFALALAAAFVPAMLFGDNRNLNIFGIFSETFDGVNWDAPPAEAANPNNVRLFTWGNPTISPQQRPADIPLNDMVDGREFWILVGGGGGQGMGITFVDSTNNTARTVDMSAFAGGYLEFWARSWVPSAPNVSFGFATGISGGDQVQTLGSLGFVANSQWQRIRIPLPSAANLTDVRVPFLVTGISPPVDIDSVVWRRPTAGTFGVTVRNISDNAEVSEISWAQNAIGNFAVAEQYIELNLDRLNARNWGIQIYTDNRRTAAPAANPQFTGVAAANPVGLVNEDDTTQALPMRWRINNGELTNFGNLTSTVPGHYWIWLTDRQHWHVDSANLYDGARYVTVWSNRGIHVNEMNFVGMSAPRRPRIYLAADFRSAVTPATYTTSTLTIEFFYDN